MGDTAVVQRYLKWLHAAAKRSLCCAKRRREASEARGSGGARQLAVPSAGERQQRQCYVICVKLQPCSQSSLIYTIYTYFIIVINYY